ncbi:MAG: aspartate carbamoyltransferase regulatory subunit [Candidatus Diapherotrites archaeon]|nr:aspartate carbamoyltransferase regulatory subunit [Candidatus Diapherotrites archaeon]
MVKKTKDGLYIKPIEKGTTIDHLPVGTALHVLNIIGKTDSAITVAIGVPSRKLGKKDLVFVENKTLSNEQIAQIALIAPGATLNIIEKNEVILKSRLEMPKKVVGLITCINPKCITNMESVETIFYIENNALARCHYCEKIMSKDDYTARLRL